jgi:hypothetical protein
MSVTPSPQGKPGGAPSVTAVIKFLKAAGFQHSRYTESRLQGRASGAVVVRANYTATERVLVHWNEGDTDFYTRMGGLGLTDVTKVPQHPDAERFAREYAEALAPRYAVRIHGGTEVYVTARETLPARPKGVPTAVTVRKALKAAEVTSRETSWHVSVVDQPDHTRVAVKDSETLKVVREALTAEGWVFEESETIQHWALKITGSMPDRRQRLAKLRQQREARATELAGRAAVAKVVEGIRQTKAAQEAASVPQEAEEPEGENAPLGAYVAWAEGPEERTEHGHVVGLRQGEALVMGLDGGLRQMPADIPEAEPEPAPVAYDGKGRPWRQGQRAEFKTRDGFLYSGKITGFGEEDGQPTAMVLVDTRRAAPASRPMYKGDPNLPGKPRPVEPPQEWTQPLNKLTPPA